MKLTRSNRSSWEIMQYALGIPPNEELVPVERHGEAPKAILCKRRSEIVRRIAGEIEESRHRLIGRWRSIAKTQVAADWLHRELIGMGSSEPP